MVLNQPLTIGTLRDQHLSLMREWRDLGSDEVRFEQASEIRRIAVEAGRGIESPAERDEAQGIVDYWASAISGLSGQSYPELLSLSAYVSAQATSTGRSVRETYEALRPPEAQRLARSIFEDLLVLGEHGVERNRPRSREALRRSAGANDGELFERVLASLLETGALVRRPGEAAEDDCFEAIDGRIADSWPALKEWLAAARTYNIERARLMDRAQQWSEAGKPPALLLSSGSAVDNALAYKGEDDLLDHYIESSRHGRARRRRAVQIFSAVGLVLLVGALAYYVVLVGKARQELVFAKDRAERAERRLQQANSRFNQAARTNAQAQANAEIAQLPDLLGVRELRNIMESIAPASDSPAGSALEGVDALSGAMWLGSDQTPQVSNLQGERVISFSQATPGTRYRARVPIYLRVAMPRSEADYASPPEKAVIPPGAQIILLSPPRGFNRDTGRQYWANVRVVPQVYIQYNNASRAEVDRIRQQIAEAGFEVPPGELRRDLRDRAEIRYFREGDGPIAARLQQVLNGIPQIASPGRVDCQSFVGSFFIGANFKLEFWYDAQGARKPGVARPCG